jgi:serpin B
MDLLELHGNHGSAAKFINDWVEQQTKHRIQNVIPEPGIEPETELVLVNAIYLKAPWEDPFWKSDTKPMPFHTASGPTADTPTMVTRDQLGYAKFNRFTAVTIPYKGSELQFLILLPDTTNGLAELEGKIVHPGNCANLPIRDVLLYLPKFKITPPPLSLASALQTLGMSTAFDERKANFERMTDWKPMFISGVFHKTFLSLDEEGTEAAAATAVEVAGSGLPLPRPKPIEVRVDHPFLFAIQHRASGACLFLGHVADPR